MTTTTPRGIAIPGEMNQNFIEWAVVSTQGIYTECKRATGLQAMLFPGPSPRVQYRHEMWRRPADEDIASGHVCRFASVEEMIEDLKSHDAE